MSDTKKWLKKQWVMPLFIFLLVLVFVSGILVGILLSRFSAQEKTLDLNISEIPTQTTPTEEVPQQTTPVEEAPQDPTQATTQPSQNDPQQETAGQGPGYTQGQSFVAAPGMSLDGGSILADITLFKTSYGENGNITIQSANGDNVIAPGATNTCKVRILNTGNCALNYELQFADLFPNALKNQGIPLEVRITDYRGNYVVGTGDTWVPLEKMQDVTDYGTVGKASHVYYMLQWRWPFDGVQSPDPMDTLLGNETEVIECGIRISAVTTMHEDPNAAGGLTTPNTGDTFEPVLWFSIMGISLLLLILLLFFRPQREEEKLTYDK